MGESACLIGHISVLPMCACVSALLLAELELAKVESSGSHVTSLSKDQGAQVQT